MAIGRVLVVDDERFFRELFGDTLRQAGHAVEAAASGEEALARLAAARFDLLVTDLIMPGMDGITLVKKALEHDPALAAVAVTGHHDVRLAVQAMKAGCADFLVKPVESEELVAVAGRALAHARLVREHQELVTEHEAAQRRQVLHLESLRLLASLDLEALQDLTLQVLMRLTDAQGAALWIADERGGLTLRAYRGLVDRATLPQRLDPRAEPYASALAAASSAGEAEAGAIEPAGTTTGEAFLVPLVADEEALGLVRLADRASGRFDAETRADALMVAGSAALAVRNARRFQSLERVGLRDRESGAYNLAYFVDYAGKEFYKARRYGRAFSLALVSVDDADRLRKVGGRELWRRVLKDLVGAVTRVVRDADILAKVSESEYYVLLPETDAFGALMFLRRAAEEIRGEASVRQLEERAAVRLSMGASVYPRDGEDFDELLHWARARVEAQRGSLMRLLDLGDLPRAAFWELTDRLVLGDGPLPASSPSARLAADEERFHALQREAAREIARDPRARGLLYVGTAGGLSRAPVLSALPPGEGAGRSSDASAHVFLLGPRDGAPPAAHPLVTEVFLDGDQRLAGHAFLLYLSEHAGYAWLSGPGGRAFHTSDVPLVDALVSKLQALYDLAPT